MHRAAGLRRSDRIRAARCFRGEPVLPRSEFAEQFEQSRAGWSGHDRSAATPSQGVGSFHGTDQLEQISRPGIDR